jgi:hypothetical protein
MSSTCFLIAALSAAKAPVAKQSPIIKVKDIIATLFMFISFFLGVIVYNFELIKSPQ